MVEQSLVPKEYQGLSALFRVPDVPEDDRGQVRAAQLRSVGAAMPFSLMASLINGAVIGLTFYQSTTGQIFLYWCIALSFLTGTLFFVYKRHSAISERAIRSERSIRHFAYVAASLGFLWGLLPFIGLPLADATGQMVLGATIVGMMFGGAYTLARVPQAAVAFLSPIIIGAILGLQLGQDARASMLSILLVVYFFVLLASIRTIYAQYLAMMIGQGAVKQQSQLISLLLRDFGETASDWLWQTNSRGILQDIPLEMSTEKPQHKIMQSGLRLSSLFEADENYEVLKLNLERRKSFRDLLLKVVVEDEAFWWLLTGKPIFEDDEFVGFRGVATDATVTKAAEDRITQMAHYDAITGLPNRVSLQERLEHEVRRVPEAGEVRALALLDLDNFKWVNDTLGHPAGDHLLKLAADRISGLVREGDMVARLGGDEFAILIRRHRGDTQSIKSFIENLTDTLNKPYNLWGSTARCSASIGVKPVGVGLDTRTLLKHADLALYQAKKLGKARSSVFTEALELKARQRREVEVDLQRALETDELEVYFQPQIDVKTREINGVEALLRWNHPTKGLVYPGAFIEAAEDSGLITRLGDWVIRAALAQAKRMPDDVRVAINISPLQIHSANLMTTIVNALAANDLHPSRLELEITETVLLTDTDFTIDRLLKLKSLGIRIVLDDFGTGYSSLSYLRRFPFDKIKIDKSFIQDLEVSSEDREIARATLSMARSLGLNCTAEGVETEYQSQFLRDEGCDQIQGYLVSRALPIEKLVHLFESSSQRSALRQSARPQRIIDEPQHAQIKLVHTPSDKAVSG